LCRAVPSFTVWSNNYF